MADIIPLPNYMLWTRKLEKDISRYLGLDMDVIEDNPMTYEFETRFDNYILNAHICLQETSWEMPHDEDSDSADLSIILTKWDIGEKLLPNIKLSEEARIDYINHQNPKDIAFVTFRSQFERPIIYNWSRDRLFPGISDKYWTEHYYHPMKVTNDIIVFMDSILRRGNSHVKDREYTSN